MSKFYGKVGFETTVETKPGIYEEIYKERNYKGDVLSHTKRWEPSDSVNDNLTTNNDISIVADSFALANFGVMRYIKWNKQTFEITSASIDVNTHRITLSLGGIFNVPVRD